MKKIGITCGDVMMSLTSRPTGTCSSLISRWPSACSSFHIHCFATTYTSVESVGGVRSWKYTTAPQAKMTMKTRNGIVVIFAWGAVVRSEEHTSELQSHLNLVCRLLLEKKKTKNIK